MGQTKSGDVRCKKAVVEDACSVQQHNKRSHNIKVEGIAALKNTAINM
jgi:hypothetical protein